MITTVIRPHCPYYVRRGSLLLVTVCLSGLSH